MEYDPEIASFDGSAHLMKLLSENTSMTQEYCEPQKKNGLNLEGIPTPHKPAMLPPGVSKLDATPDTYMVPPADVYDNSSLNSLFETIPVAPAQQRWQPDSTFKEDPQEVRAVGCMLSVQPRGYCVTLSLIWGLLMLESVGALLLHYKLDAICIELLGGLH